MTALQRVNGLLQEAEQQAATRRKFTNALVNSLEGIVKTFTQKEMHTVLPIQDAILTCVADALTMGTAKEIPKILKAKESVTKTSPILTWAGVVKTPKAGGPPTAPQSGAPKANSAKKNAAKANKRCKTGWALHPKSLEVRDILMKEAHKLKICEITGATRLDLPETWYNHRVRQVPRSLFSAIDGQVKVTEEMVAREARIQTGIAPVRCLESFRSGTENAWIVSFTTPVAPFRLFGATPLSFHLPPRSQVELHKLGCQTYCNIYRCTRPARCNNCSIAKAKHQGLMHELCPAPVKCNGCHGPFPAGHKGCPLAPRSTAGGKPQCNLTKAQVEAIRRNNRAVQKACASGTATGTVQAMRTFQAGAQSTRSSQSTQSSTNSTAPSSTTRTPALTRVEIQVPATPREGGESAKRTTDSPVRSGEGREDSPTPHITVAWANVGKGAGAHSVLLQLAYENGVDVVCVQEPWSSPGTKTQNHPAYECYAPYDSWEAEEATEREAERPRTMSYIRRGAAIQAQQRRGERNRDVVWLEVNGYHIVNIYREPNTMAMINYTIGIIPGPRTLVGGDFNAKHDTYEPGVLSATQGATLSNWSQDTGMDFIGEVGIPTHRAGHVIDLTFSNIPFAETVIRRDIDYGSDHYTQITTIPGRGILSNKRVGYRVTEDGLYTFASLIESETYWLLKVMYIASDVELETATEQFTDLFQRAIRTAGLPASDQTRSAPWWINESVSAYSLYKRSGKIVEDRKRIFSATHKAKREYWRRLIDSVSDNADLYKVIGWHRAALSLKSPPFVVDGQLIKGTREKAQALLDKLLHKYDSINDLEADPILENCISTLPWDTNVSFEEVERNIIGVSSISPGVDKVTVWLLKAY
ncbi:hypothetical protein DID88_006490 [Monilinia fructigena]|uniref:Endonuclease/exonuclease/phosphatase domain-containing protein n=1 Tax=Monilinia fructigena TaxID=38457 RepID=A0A395IHH1_9HELO|nr:hypothetical protein DID88_006490 [Monilinia fructigena]